VSAPTRNTASSTGNSHARISAATMTTSRGRFARPGAGGESGSARTGGAVKSLTITPDMSHYRGSYPINVHINPSGGPGDRDH
jgi:hypothetical protein